MQTLGKWTMELKEADEVWMGSGYYNIGNGVAFVDVHHEDDARIIAAAPELLSALIEVRDNVREDSPDMWRRVDAAIAKALGTKE